MPITDNTYYKNEIYIPHAKPGITSDSTTVSLELNEVIEEYERECLVKSLGLTLADLFMDELDDSQSNGLKVGSDPEWNDLLNGKTYTNPAGDSVSWKGIRRKALTADTAPSKSFLANYVYYHYEKSADIFRTGIGHVKIKGKNSEEVSASPKVTNAWRRMVDIIQGDESDPNIMVRSYGVGIDYYSANKEITLYQFIKDINNATPDTYPDFKPGYWNTQKNQLGI